MTCHLPPAGGHFRTGFRGPDSNRTQGGTRADFPIGFNLWQAADSGDTLAADIKSITEDTGNLIASYVNAIRSDVSQLRAMQSQGWDTVKQIRALMPPPTVWEYMAKIEAHTANTSRNTAALLQKQEQILDALQSVITTEDGAPSFRALI